MKPYSTGSSLVTEIPASKDSQLYEKEKRPEFYKKLDSALSSTTVYALMIFALLNIMLLIVYGPYHRATTKSRDADKSLRKLHQRVFDSLYESNQSGPWPWWVARAYFGNSSTSIPPPDVVILGDSQANAAIIQADAVAANKSMDCASDRQCLALKDSLKQTLKPAGTNLRLTNLSIGGAMPSDFYLMCKALFTKNQHPKLVIITLSPRSFLDATLPDASSTDIFDFFSPFVDLGHLDKYAFNNPVQKWFWLAQRNIVLFACRQDVELWLRGVAQNYLCKMFPEKSNGLLDESSRHQSLVQSIYASNGIVPAGSSVVGPVPLLSFKENKKEYSKRFAAIKQETLKGQSAFLLATLKYLAETKVPVMVIEMPMLPTVKALLPDSFWKGYRTGLKNSCFLYNAHWFDLDDDKEFSQREFLDYVHLNAAGGQHFVNKVAKFITNDEYLRACLH
jgi:hypothetical protein